MLGLEVGFSKIFTDDTKEEELDAANEHDNASEAGPTRDWVAEGKGFHDDDDDHNKSDKAEEDSEESGEGKRNGGEGDDAFDSILE